MKAYTLDRLKFLKMLCYGDPGTGKTTFIATAMDCPVTSPMLMLVTGGNPESLFHSRQKKGLPMPDLLEIDKASDLSAVYNYLKSGQKSDHPFAKKLFPEIVGHEYVEYKSVAFDHLTELQRILMDEILENAKKGPGDELARAEYKDWGEVLSRMTFVVREFFRLPMSVMIAALEKDQVDQVTKVVKIRPSLWGQAADEVPAYALLVSRLVFRSQLDASKFEISEDPIGKDTHCIAIFGQSGKFQAKDQYGSLPPFMPNPTIQKIIDKILIEGK